MSEPVDRLSLAIVGEIWRSFSCWWSLNWAPLLETIGILATAVAAMIGAHAFLPWCDFHNVSIVEDDQIGGVKITTQLKNAGLGPALGVWIDLLEYDGIPYRRQWENYVGTLAPSERRFFVSQRLELSGHNFNPNARFIVLMRWEVFFWFAGEAYVEERFDRRPRQKRVVLLWPLTRAWRALCRRLGYDRFGRPPR